MQLKNVRFLSCGADASPITPGYPEYTFMRG